MEQRLIDADALKTDFQERLKKCDKWIAKVANDHDLLTRALATRDFICEVIMTIDNAPTIEERPKGKWRSVGFEKGYAFCICSNCGKTTKLVRDNRNEFCCLADIREKAVACLYCGADMRGDV